MRPVRRSLTLSLAAVLFWSVFQPVLAAPFIRGDANQDDVVDVSDAVSILIHLFLDPQIECEDAADVDDSGAIDTSDAVYSLTFQFASGPPPPSPFPEAGTDPTPDNLTCPPEMEVDVQAPELTITSPANLLVVGDPVLQVTGEVSDANFPASEITVTVNGQPAAVDPGDGTFQAEVMLREGTNQITAVAVNPDRGTGSTTISVVLDTLPPTVVIENPPLKASKQPGESDFVTQQARVTLTGFLNDIGSAQVGGEAGSVTVRSFLESGEVVIGDQLADLEGKAWLFVDFPLRRGVNIIEVVGTDGAGNTSAPVQRRVTFQDIFGQRITRVSGDRQGGTIFDTLREPMVVSLIDQDGRPVPNRSVKFEVVRNSGLLSLTSTGAVRSRELLVPTNALGQAQVFLTLGDRPGAGYNRVMATAAGFQGEVLFCSTALPRPPSKILATEGVNQTGIPGQALPLPLVALAVDSEGNPIADLPITFEVVEGGGTLSQGGTNGGGLASDLVVPTNSEGLAAAVFHLGLREGLNAHLAVARFEGLSGLSAAYNASAKMPRTDTPTAVVGLVLDNSDVPLENVTVSLVDSGLPSVVSDSEGFFRIENAPVGSVHLRADGTTTTRPGPISFVAAVPGIYTAPASRAYLYYSDEHKHWVEPMKVEIAPAS